MRRSNHRIIFLAFIAAMITTGCGSEKDNVLVPVPLKAQAWFVVSEDQHPHYVFEVNGVDYDAELSTDDNDPNAPWFEVNLRQPLGTYDTALVVVTNQERIPYVSTAIGKYPIVGGGPTCLTKDSERYRYRVEHDDEAYSVVGDLTNCIANQQ